MRKLINRDKSIIPACDFESLETFKTLIQETNSFQQIGAYKIGATLGLMHSLPKLCEIARKHTVKPLIYDHQKAGTDIPETGKSFMKMLKSVGFDAAIIFPQSGPTTEKAWIEAALEVDLQIICGGYMTHKNYIASDGGFILDEAPDKMYINAANLGVKDFVVPGNKPEVITHIKNMLMNYIIDPVFYSPGFVSQGGTISDAAIAAGSSWHAIVGRAIYEAKDINSAVKQLISEL